jgi:hypothetical protein
MADIINGKPIYDKPVDNSIPENPEEPVTYITNLPGEMAKFKEDSQLRMPDITAPNNDKFMFIPETPQGEVNFRKEWPDVDVLPMPWNQSGDPNFKIPNQPSEEDLAFFEKRERFKKVIYERLGIDPQAIAKQAEKDYLNRFPAEQRTPQVYAAAANHGRQARIEAEKAGDPYLTMFEKRFKGEGGNKTVEQLTAEALRGNKEAQSVLDAMKKRQIEIAQAGQGSFKELPFDSQELYYEQYYRTKTIPPFAYRDAQSRNAFIQGFSEWAKRNNIQGADVVAQRAEVDALTKSQANQEKVRGMMGGFVRNINKQVDRVDQIGQDLVSRVGVRALDLPIRELKTRFAGSGQERVLESYLMEISNEIGKLSTGSSASIAELSAEAQKRWSGVHDPNLSINELKKILDATREQANMRITSSDEELKYTRERLGGGKNNPAGPRDIAPLVQWLGQHKQFDDNTLSTYAKASGWTDEELSRARGKGQPRFRIISVK